VVRIVNDTMPQFAIYMGGLGFPQPLLWVWAITLVEIVCGSLMIVGIKVRWMALGLFAIAAGGIVLIHAKLGWFVGEHGTGGSEYSVCLILCLLVIAAADAERPGSRQ
jgi:putative oxidoreductase